MADTFTANYNLIKPEVNGSRDTWGTKENLNWDNIDGILKNLSDNKLNKAGAKSLTGTTDFDTLPTLKVVEGETTTQLPFATQKWVLDQLKALIPDGVIIKWKGTYATIPAGWKLCDGTGGTIDLRDKFIVGAGLNYNPGNTGGALQHNHGGTTLYAYLSTDQMPSHNHGVNDPWHTHGYADPGHYHGYQAILSSTTQGYPGAVGTVAAYSVGNYSTSYSQTGIAINGAPTGISIGYVGSGAGHLHGINMADSRPPYYALCFIQRVWPA